MAYDPTGHCSPTFRPREEYLLNREGMLQTMSPSEIVHRISNCCIRSNAFLIQAQKPEGFPQNSPDDCIARE